MKILTLGTFDLFHADHVGLLKFCSSLGDTYVAVNPDDFVERFKGRRPAIPLEDRLCVIRACRYVTQAFENFGEEDSTRVIEQVRPDKIVVGADWKDRDYLKQLGTTQAWLDQRGIEVIYYLAPRRTGSSEIKAKIRNS